MAATVALDRRVRRDEQGMNPEGERGHGAAAVVILGALAAGGVWYWEAHRCSPACGPCESCSGGHCTTTCPAGQICSADGKTCVIPVDPNACNPPCAPGFACASGNCVSTAPPVQPPPVQPPPVQPPPSSACTYTVRSGDILIHIAARVYGRSIGPDGGIIWEWLYNQNPQIRAIAQQHGFFSNWWAHIWPGEVIHCPPYPGLGQPNCNV